MEALLKAKRQVVCFVPYRKNSSGKLEVFLQMRDANAPVYAKMFSLFGGGIEVAEDTEEALRREVMEELQYSAAKSQYFGHFSNGYSDFYVFIEEVDSDFEARITVLEGEYGSFLTFDDIACSKLVSPIACLVAEAMQRYFKDSY